MQKHVTKPADAGVRYLFEKAQEAGAIREIRPGFLWLRMPLPFVLNHVNIWLLEDKGRWTLIDTGADRPEAQKIWQTVLDGRAIESLICTHGHPDHVGLAGWLVEKLGIPLHMTLTEWLAPQVWREEGLKPMRPEMLAYWRSHGLPAKAVEAMQATRHNSTFRNFPLPSQFQRMRDGDVVGFGGRRWTVLVNGGHADEHASLFSAEDRILIAGDQVLSKISPVVGVFPSQPDADPLADYLKSLKRLAKLPADTLVLPSHGLPFIGIKPRVAALTEHHRARLAELHAAAAAAEAVTAHELLPVLFRRQLDVQQQFFAMGESIAHLNHLWHQRRLERIVGDDGVIRFKSSQE